MVAIKPPGLNETYRALCAVLKENPKLAVYVTNHIAAKHSVHSLPAFHTSGSITEAEKLTTYGEIVQALVANKPESLKGQVAGGQAATPEPDDEDRIPTVMRPDEPKPRVILPDPAPHPLPHRHSVLPEVKPELPHPKAVAPNDTPANAPFILGPTAKPRGTDPFADRLRELLVEVIGEMPATMDEGKVGEIVDAKLTDHTDAITTNVSKIVESALKPRDDALAISLKALGDAVENRLKQVAAGSPSITVHEFRVAAAVNTVEGVIHRQLPQVVAWLQADVPVWLWGCAGGGKTHLARQAAKALDLPFYCAPIDETTTVGKLVGFRNVSNGEFVKGLMYDAYKGGGVQLLDEIDTNGTAIPSTNSLLANGHYTFPNGEEVERSKSFRLIAGGNTKGTGAVAGYTARIRMDAATLDRFAIIKLDYDPGLELALTCGVPTTSQPWKAGEPATTEQCELFVKWVQKVRAAARDSVLISPRASYLGVKALRVGIPLAEVVDALVFKLVTPDTQSRLTGECGTAY